MRMGLSDSSHTLMTLSIHSGLISRGGEELVLFLSHSLFRSDMHLDKQDRFGGWRKGTRPALSRISDMKPNIP